ncbi:MAG TPA: GlsB/YeaQ/YmgE family stress response membrane protein [Candidatus Limnocylindria bacterium]
MDITTLLIFLVVGLIVGLIARFLVPGPDPMGWVSTMVLGVLGSFVGGTLANLLLAGQATVQSAGWIGSIIGAVILLLIYRAMSGRRVTV